jgi:hypothetical protein
MHHAYDLHSWSKHRRQEALREARVRDLCRSTRSPRAARRPGARTAGIWSSVRSLLGRTEVVE